LNGTYKLVVYADNCKSLCRVVWCRRKTTVKENREAFLVAYLVSLEVNVEKTKYIFLFSQQTSGQSHTGFNSGKVQFLGITDKTQN
jgi:hypothetical protein